MAGKLVDFPTESVRRGASIDTSSLKEVHCIVEQLTDQIARGVFEGNLMQAALHRQEEFSKLELDYNDQIFALKRELGRMELERNDYAPSDLKEALERFRKKLAAFPIPTTTHLQKELQSLFDQWDRIHFLFEFPIAEELDPDSFQSNFAHRMFEQIHVAEEFNPKYAAALRKNLTECQMLLNAALEIYSGKGSHIYDSMPNGIRREIRQRFISLEGDKERCMAEALMQALQERVS